MRDEERRDEETLEEEKGREGEGKGKGRMNSILYMLNIMRERKLIYKLGESSLYIRERMPRKDAEKGSPERKPMTGCP